MKNSSNYNSIDDQKFPDSQKNNIKNNNQPSEDANIGDWINERDEAGTDPHRYEQDKNNNSGGSGSAGSEANKTVEDDN